MERHPQQWQAGRQHSPSEFIKDIQPLWDLACCPDQPFGDSIQAVARRPFADRALEHSCGQDISLITTGGRRWLRLAHL
jgi:hypothetical protein